VISGEVMYPGEYVLADRTESLYQLLQRAGGFTENAFPNGLVLERPTIDESLSRLRVPDLLEKSNPLVQDSLGNVHREIVFDYEPESINRIIVDMSSILESRGRIGDVVLEPGDHVTIPSIPSGISVMGAVGSNGTIGFVPDKTVKHYIRRAGNFTKQADKDNTRLIRANGEVIAGGAQGKRVELGDVIVVPTKIDRDRDWFRTLTTAVTATTGILTTALLIGKL
jgi:protein involved in polysaccharide export with SLBB domain